MSKLGTFTLIIPYYRNPLMLERQLEEIVEYPEGVRVVIVDDASSWPAEPLIAAWPQADVALYRIEKDVPWNRGGARNLGAQEAKTDWIVHVDIDHVLTVETAIGLLEFTPKPRRWYRFRRCRVGCADATRRKDKLPAQAEFGEIHPHVDSYLIERAAYWDAGGYDERYSGVLGGGGAFLKVLERKYGKPSVLPEGLELHVYTRDAVADANDLTLSRNPALYTKRRLEIESGRRAKVPPVNFEWKRVL